MPRDADDRPPAPDHAAPGDGPPGDPRQVRARTLHRVIAFNDAVVAIAMTLLVLPLVDLALAYPDNRSAGSMLAGHYGEIIAFAVSFLVVMRAWAGHRRLYDALVDYDEALLRLNTWWLMAVVFLPFPTARLFAQTRVSTGSVLFYLCTLLVISLAGLAQSWLVSHRTRWIRPGEVGTVRAHLLTSVAMCAVFVIAALVTLVQPVLGLFALMLSAVARLPIRRALRRSSGRDRRVV
jgi:uncharacterized membrane protein